MPKKPKALYKQDFAMTSRCLQAYNLNRQKHLEKKGKTMVTKERKWKFSVNVSANLERSGKIHVSRDAT